MKHLLIFTLILVGIINEIMADTIDYCHVYRNKIQIGNFNVYGGQTVIKINDAKKIDSITVEYGTCSFCRNCSTFLTVEDENQHVIISIPGKGTIPGEGIFSPISFTLDTLLLLKKSNGTSYFNVFFSYKSNLDKKLVFQIKLE